MAEWDWELLAGPDGIITEGPAWDGTGLMYSVFWKNEIRRYDPETYTVSIPYTDCNGTNGLYFGPDGSLYACESTRVVRYDTCGIRHELVDSLKGKRLNTPNDLILDSAGRIWFTDPRYGDQGERELDHCSVYRITPTADGSTPWPIERLTFDTTRPNGLLLSADERTLFLAESDFLPGINRQLQAYPVNDDGSLGVYTELHDFGDARGIDGICWDANGQIVATCGDNTAGPGPRIAIFATDGAVLEEHLLPDGDPTNCIFGGADLIDLYVTTLQGHLYRVGNTGCQGALQPPRTSPFIG